MSLFPKILTQLIHDSNKSQNAICKDLGVSKQKLSKWKTAYNEPCIDEIIMIAKYFDITTDYLLGVNNELQ